MYKILSRKPVGKRPPERPLCRWRYIIKMDLKETWCGLGSAGYRINSGDYGSKPMGSIKGGISRLAVTTTFLMILLHGVT
jgi:hypothetical protein